jgi:hypothetical protein
LDDTDSDEEVEVGKPVRNRKRRQIDSDADWEEASEEEIKPKRKKRRQPSASPEKSVEPETPVDHAKAISATYFETRPSGTSRTYEGPQSEWRRFCERRGWDDRVTQDKLLSYFREYLENTEERSKHIQTGNAKFSLVIFFILLTSL